MSNLDNRIQQEIDAIKALRTADETPPGQDGDEWDNEFEAFADGVQAALGDAAPDSIRNADGSIGANVDNDTTTTGELSVGGGMSGGNVYGLGTLSFAPEFVGIPFPNGNDPELFHKRNFSDGQYRIIMKDKSDTKTELYKTSDFSNYTKISDDIRMQYPQDHVILPNGDFAVYNFDMPGEKDTGVWTGPSLTDLSKVGVVMSDTDVGTFIDGDTIHLYAEDKDFQSGPSSEKISHYTTSANSLLNATEQTTAIDFRDKPWHGGDPDIIEISGTYYMFIDNTSDHPRYYTALYRSDDLSDWELVTDRLQNTESGDMVVAKGDFCLHAFTEFTKKNQGVGYWRLYPERRFNELGLDALNAKEQRLTGETFIEATTIAKVLEKGEWRGVIGSVLEDNRGEMSTSSSSFVPDKEGYYTFSGGVIMRAPVDNTGSNPFAPGQTLKARIRDLDNNKNMGNDPNKPSPFDDIGHQITMTVEKAHRLQFDRTQRLNEGTRYQLQVQNQDGMVGISGNGTRVQIKWSNVQPRI